MKLVLDIIPDTGFCEPRLFTDRRDCRVHQGMGLDKSQSFIWKFSRRPITFSKAMSCTATRPKTKRKYGLNKTFTTIHHEFKSQCFINSLNGTRLYLSCGFFFLKQSPYLGFGTLSSGTAVQTESGVFCSLNLALKAFSMSSIVKAQTAEPGILNSRKREKIIFLVFTIE